MNEALHDALLLARAGRAAGGKRAMTDHFEMIIQVLNDAQPPQKTNPKKTKKRKPAR